MINLCIVLCWITVKKWSRLFLTSPVVWILSKRSKINTLLSSLNSMWHDCYYPKLTVFVNPSLASWNAFSQRGELENSAPFLNAYLFISCFAILWRRYVQTLIIPTPPHPPPRRVMSWLWKRSALILSAYFHLIRWFVSLGNGSQSEPVYFISTQRSLLKETLMNKYWLKKK